MSDEAMKPGTRVRSLAQRRRSRGFTLIELMIAVAIVAILAMIALPSYRAYILRANRAQAKVDMMQTAQAMERFYSLKRDYTQATTYCGKTLPSPPNGTAVYNITPVCDPNGRMYVITATPLGQQATYDPCGALTLDQTGAKSYATHNQTGTATQCAW